MQTLTGKILSDRAAPRKPGHYILSAPTGTLKPREIESRPTFVLTSQKLFGGSHVVHTCCRSGAARHNNANGQRLYYVCGAVCHDETWHPGLAAKWATRYKRSGQGHELQRRRALPHLAGPRWRRGFQGNVVANLRVNRSRGNAGY